MGKYTRRFMAACIHADGSKTDEPLMVDTDICPELGELYVTVTIPAGPGGAQAQYCVTIGPGDALEASHHLGRDAREVMDFIDIPETADEVAMSESDKKFIREMVRKGITTYADLGVAGPHILDQMPARDLRAMARMIARC
jgi:hypothetical protein